MIPTSANVPVSEEILSKYFHSLVNSFFKILPIWESGEPSILTYIESLQIELLGCKGFLLSIKEDPLFISLISILQYFIDTPDCDVSVVKREVFRAISICNKLSNRYANCQDETKEGSKHV